MTTLIPTKDTGAVAKANRSVYGEPAQQVTDEMLDQQLVDTGLNGPFLADFLSGALTHERCGRHLYRSCAARSAIPELRGKYEEFGAETERHVEILEQLIVQAGGNPSYVSPTARAVEGSDSKLLESTFALSGAADPLTAEMSMLDAVLLAEAMDQANWQLIASLAEQLPEGEIRDAFEAAVVEVEPQEDEHLGWAQTTKQQLVTSSATGAAMFAFDGNGLANATKDELYEAAREADIPGRSQMTKDELLEELVGDE
jgi:rubrerythrin